LATVFPVALHPLEMPHADKEVRMVARPILGLVAGVLALALLAGPASAAAQDAECTGELSAAVVRNLTVPAGATCVLRDSTVTGQVSVSAASYFQAARTRIAGDVSATDAQTLYLDRRTAVHGGVRADRVAQVFMFSTRIRKSVKVDHTTAQVFICGTTVERGSIRVIRSARDIVIGDPGDGGCAGNTVRRGDMSVLWNKTDVQLVVSGNRFPRGNLLVAGNFGPSRKVVRGNFGGNHIACEQNSGQFRASKNRRWDTGVCGR
jgi:hypothetical protein